MKLPKIYFVDEIPSPEWFVHQYSCSVEWQREREHRIRNGSVFSGGCIYNRKTKQCWIYVATGGRPFRKVVRTLLHELCHWVGDVCGQYGNSFPHSWLDKKPN